MKVTFNVYDAETENDSVIKEFEIHTSMLVMYFENKTTANYIMGKVDKMKVLCADDVTLHIIAVTIAIKDTDITLFQVNAIKYDYECDMRILCKNGDEF